MLVRDGTSFQNSWKLYRSPSKKIAALASDSSLDSDCEERSSGDENGVSSDSVESISGDEGGGSISGDEGGGSISGDEGGEFSTERTPDTSTAHDMNYGEV